MGSEKRKRTKRITIRCSPDEYAVIENNAKACSVTVPELLRQLGQNVEPRSTLDAQHIRELARINGDMGRLGGLLKLWLTEKEGFANSLNVPETMKELKELKALLAEKVDKL